MSFKAVCWAFEQDGMAPGQKFLLVTMAEVASDDGKSFSSCETLCRKTGFSKEETITSGQKKLTELGLIADTGKRVGSTGKVKVWQLHPDACRERPEAELIALFQPTGNPPSNGILNPPAIPRQSPGNPPFDGNSHIDGTRNVEPRVQSGKTKIISQRSKTGSELCAEVAEEIYKAYPLKVGKPAALKAIRKAMCRVDAGILLEKTQAFAAARNGDTAFCPHPATWFNQARYNDDPKTWNRSVTPPARPPELHFEL